MRLVRFGEPGKEKPALMDLDDNRRDLSSQFKDWNVEFFAANGLVEIAKLDPRDFPLVPAAARWGAPIARPGKIICIGLNYSDHAEESGMPIPTEPIVFMKAANTISGPYDQVLIPRGGEKTDWEVELAVIIGKNARYLDSPEMALGYVGGYMLSHDVSERAFQLERGGQWTKGKSCDTFQPLGPWIATTDEIDDVNALGMSLSVNGAVRQKGSTAKMIFGVGYLVHYLSQFMTLEAGDVISPGTPPGVGLGMKPPTYLKDGDVVELSIDLLGSQRQSFVQA
jgi:2,4-diketo-3-deoxy-L-fuconate hydrolase